MTKSLQFPSFLFWTCLLLIFQSPKSANAQQSKKITVNTSQILAEVKPAMWGVFFEDINFGADGGIYAELIKNRSFEFPKPLMGWQITRENFVEGDALITNKSDGSNNLRFIRIDAGKGTIALVNEGFRGIGFKTGTNYNFSAMYQTRGQGQLRIQLLDSKNTVIGETSIAVKPSERWSTVSATIKSNSTVEKGKFKLVVERGAMDLDMISLFPEDTWKNRPNGLRKDMVQLLADMKPGFIRFPGGCIVEGTDLNNRYQWKKTIGPVADRQLIVNRWNNEFPHRAASDYYQSFGLGFFEYFQLAEDIGSEPLPILNCGMACQFNSGEVVPLDELDPYVQDALDLIEFANGDTNTKWGKIRADLGHPKPFQLKLLGVGNENWGPQYLERLALFTKAIKAKYPEINLINSSGTDPEGGRFNLLNDSLRKNKADFIDEHYYRPAEWFLKNAGRYDSYPRNGSKVFVGEYAVHADGSIVGAERNNWQSALASASLMTGLERNADVVQMASYAPLFAHKDAWQWAPDLIWTDNLTVYGTPDYYVQKLFALNKGTHVVSIQSNGKNLIGQEGLYASSVLDQKKKELIIKITNTNTVADTVSFDLQGSLKFKPTVQLQEMIASNLKQTNTFENPELVAPSSKNLNLKGKHMTVTLSPNSFSVIKIPYR